MTGDMTGAKKPQEVRAERGKKVYLELDAKKTEKKISEWCDIENSRRKNKERYIETGNLRLSK